MNSILSISFKNLSSFQFSDSRTRLRNPDLGSLAWRGSKLSPFVFLWFMDLVIRYPTSFFQPDSSNRFFGADLSYRNKTTFLKWPKNTVWNLDFSLRECAMNVGPKAYFSFNNYIQNEEDKNTLIYLTSNTWITPTCLTKYSFNDKIRRF